MTKPVSLIELGDYCFFIDDFLLNTGWLSDFQALSLLEICNYEWQNGEPPETLKEWIRLLKPKRERQRKELSQLFEYYETQPFIRTMRLQRAKAIRKLQESDWPFIRQRILERDSFICAYCGARANSVDHITPRAQGGLHDFDNLVAACRRCNSRKKDRTPEQARMPILFVGGRRE